MQYIAIIGGAGYIGSHTLKALHESGQPCLVIDNLAYGHRETIPDGVPFFCADLADKTSLSEVFAQYDIKSVIHFAAYTYVGESVSEPAKYYANNVVGTLTLLDTMLARNIKNIIFSSSCAVYGLPAYTPLDEVHPTNPISPYGNTKRIIEQVLADYGQAYGLRSIALRYFNAAGAALDGSLGESHSPETHLIPLVLKAINSNGGVSVFGNDYPTPDGTCIRDYIHVADLAQAHIAALDALPAYSGPLNLGTGVGYSVLDVIHTAERISGRPCKYTIKPRRPGDPPILLAASQKVASVLQWQPTVSDLDTIIASAWEWELNKNF